MKFTVAWTRRALNQLIKIWQEGPERAEITAAVREIDRALARDAENAGESGDPGVRRLAELPLFVMFHVAPADRLATVLRVKRFRLRN